MTLMPNDVKTIVAVIQSELGSIKSTIEETKQMIQRHIDECDQKYAPKWVENVLSKLVGLTLSAVIMALLGLVVSNTIIK